MEYGFNNFPYKKFKKFRYVPKSKKDKKYINAFLSFDIETSTIQSIEHSFMYSWCIGIEDTDYIRGTTWKQFIYTLRKIRDYSRPHDKYVIWVFNLDYEFAFLRGIYDFQPEEVFALNPHRILKCEMFGMFEFRCAHKLAGQQLNLAKFMKQENVPDIYRKSSLYNYDKIRFSDSRLKRYEKIYIRNDCIGLNIAVRHFIESRGYNLRTTPLTITGFLRVELRQDMRKKIGQRYFTERAPDIDLIDKLHTAFRGGNTHANPLYIGREVSEVYTYDIKSSYPAQLYFGRYPIEPFRKSRTEDIERNLSLEGYAKLIHIEFFDVELTDFFEPVPYIPINKCINLSSDFIADNGRLRESSHFFMWITDIDLEIIAATYTYKFKVHELYLSRYDFLPGDFRDFVYDIFKNKETLEKNTVEYKIYKGLLNSIYGDLVMYPLKPELLYKGSYYDINERTVEFYDKFIHKNTKLYQWGVWCTALARRQLQDGIKLITDSRDFLYCDTDSVKFKGSKYFQFFEDYNITHLKNPLKLGYFMPDEPFKYDKFKTYGAKKYAYTCDDRISIVVAGVPKSGAAELEDLTQFKIGKVFCKTGKKRIKHNDDYGAYFIKNHRVYISANACLIDTEYSLDITKDLQDIAEKIYFKEITKEKKEIKK